MARSSQPSNSTGSHERAAGTHQRAAAVHAHAADLFDNLGKPQRAARERDLANRERAGAVLELSRALAEHDMQEQ
jgi:hypothetical protein